MYIHICLSLSLSVYIYIYTHTWFTIHVHMYIHINVACHGCTFPPLALVQPLPRGLFPGRTLTLTKRLAPLSRKKEEEKTKKY